MDVTNLTRGEKIYEGKANTLYSTNDPNVLEMESTDRISAGNGEKKDVVEGKGLTNNKISTALFKLFEKEGIPTHFVGEGTNEHSKFVRKADMIKLEVIGRFIAAGSFCKRYNIESGKKFKRMTFELCYKDDSLGDPFISSSAAVYGLNVVPYDADLDDIEHYTYQIGRIAQDFFNKFDLTLVDFKVEFGYDEETGKLILCDEFSPDTCRLWDKDGKSFDKDVFRKGLGNTQETYKAILDIVEGN